MTVADYYTSHQRNGRAVLKVHLGRDGLIEPRVWICRLERKHLGPVYLGVDDDGPNWDGAHDYSFLIAVEPTDSASSVLNRWKAHRQDVLNQRQAKRRGMTYRPRRQGAA